MKKTITLFLALALCLGLCACGNNSKYAKYDELIGCIESDDYMGAIAELNKFVQPENYIAIGVDPNGQQTEPTAEDVRVEITLENWQEYFEITLVDEWRKNAFGDITSFSHMLVFQLKESYADRVADAPEENGFDVEVGFHCTNYQWTVDFENQTYTKGNLQNDYGGYKTNICQLWIHNGSDASLRRTSINNNFRSTDGTGSIVITEYDNIEVLRIQGTLVLKGQ